MKWSRYSLLFESRRNGWLLYNSASNAFLQIEDKAVPVIQQIQEDPSSFDFSKDPALFFQLRGGGFLVEDTQDDDLFNILKMRRLTADYAGNTLLLTIAPTRACNFACPYCYEENRETKFMTEETEDKIVEFIRKRQSMQNVSIVWYGGEPLLAFDRIRRLNKKIMELGRNVQAQMITNGYRLTEEVIAAFDELHMKMIQVTLDGSRETHDGRRFLIGGGKTFDTIVSNLDRLMASEWDGFVSLRVNVDTTNSKDFIDVYNFIWERYPDKYGKHISVYPGFVHGDEPANPDTNCFFSSKDKGEFLLNLAEEYGISPLAIFPHMSIGGCTMTKRNAYVIGPEGELYKCWNDIGIPELVIGHVDSINDWNMSLVAEGMVGCSYLESEECKSCFFFPICDGGCNKVRLENKRKGLPNDTCSYFKSHLKELLEAHYEQKQRSK